MSSMICILNIHIILRSAILIASFVMSSSACPHGHTCTVQHWGQQGQNKERKKTQIVGNVKKSHMRRVRRPHTTMKLWLFQIFELISQQTGNKIML